MTGIDRHRPRLPSGPVRAAATGCGPATADPPAATGLVPPCPPEVERGAGRTATRSPAWQHHEPGSRTTARAAHHSLTAFVDLVDGALSEARVMLAEAVLLVEQEQGQERVAAPGPPVVGPPVPGRDAT